MSFYSSSDHLIRNVCVHIEIYDFRLCIFGLYTEKEIGVGTIFTQKRIISQIIASNIELSVKFSVFLLSI